jgi:radical SAM superfamily enzyme YgiQ (UPF0313 family)
MKITFIRPNLFPGRSYEAMTPLCFAILKSLTPPGVETVLYDERLEEIPFDEPTDLVALTVETYTARRSYQIAARYRKRGIPVVMGGYHPTFLPEEAGQHADAVVTGDAEGTWEQVVKDVANSKLQRRYGATDFQPLGGLVPDRSIFKGKRYSPIELVQYGRGCKFNCDFCSIRAFYGASLRQRPLAEVVQEIEGLRRRHIFFVDDNLFVNLEQAKALFEALIPLNKLWSCQVSIDVARDPELLDLMRRSGCISVLIGFESLNPSNLKQMRKGWNVKWLDYATSIQRIQQAGIMIYGTFVFGYDHDTVEAFQPTVEFATRHKFLLANFNPLTPTPKAALFNRLAQENRLLYKQWWLDSEFRYGDATFAPRGMSAQDLTRGCYRARTRFNQAGSIARRLFEPNTNLRTPYRAGVYLMSNLISRREIHRKQGMQLGDSGPLTTARAAS